MSQSFWLMVVLVATMVCNGYCRPREVHETDIHKSIKQTELETPIRYENHLNTNQNDDSVSYLRIDIPYKTVHTIKTSEKVSIKNDNIVDNFVPISLISKKSNIKKWPSDQNGIESSDDLSLYNNYTSNINPLATENSNIENFHKPPNRPSILILEELTTRRPFFEPPENVHTRPIQVFNKPIRPPLNFFDRPFEPPLNLFDKPTRPPLNTFTVYPVQHKPEYAPSHFQQSDYIHQNIHNIQENTHQNIGQYVYGINKPFEATESTQSVIPIHIKPPDYISSPSYSEENQYFPTTQNPGYDSVYSSIAPPGYPNRPVKPTHPTTITQTETTYPTYTEHYLITTTENVEITTKKRKQNKCPSISVVASSSVNNNNSINKEGCQDISIHIDTNINNSNTLTATTKSPPTTVAQVQNDSNTQTGIFGIFEIFWSIISRIFNLTLSNPILSTILTPFLTGGIGLSALMLPWSIPHMLWGGDRKINALLENHASKPIKYSQITDYSVNLKRSTRDLREVLPPWYHGKGKKISSSEVSQPTTEQSGIRSDKEENNTNNAKGTKLNIESIATVARASSDGPSIPSSAAFGQLIDTVSQMVDSDIRTPPKLKEIIKEKTNENRRDALGENPTLYPVTVVYDEEVSKTEGAFEISDKTLSVDFSEGKAASMKPEEGMKGIAIPVVMDDMDSEPTMPPKKMQKIPEVPKPIKDDKKKNGVTKPHPTTTPSSGLSTWILLSDNRDTTTPSSKKNNNNNNKKENNEEKKKLNGGGPTTKKPSKNQTTNLKSTTPQANKKATTKPSVTSGKKPEADVNSMSALEAMVKNQKKLTTTPKPKINEDSKLNNQKKQTDVKKKYTDRLEVAETKDKFEIELPDSKTTFTLPTNLAITTDTNTGIDLNNQHSQQGTTESSVEGTTKKKKLTTKKKKKNKNRRRKPSNDTGVEAKIPPQPVGSQIYNFLSREIVPTVGLGLIGVALTAGLASFLGYNPFSSSSVPLRRTYESYHGYNPNNYYNYNTDFGDGGQSEEVLFREVLSGMPEDSRYGLTNTDSKYPEAYNRQDAAYDSMKSPINIYSSASGNYNTDKDISSYDPSYSQDYSNSYGTAYDSQDKRYTTNIREKYPAYNQDTGTSFVYPEATMVSSPDKTSRHSDDYNIQTTSDKTSKGSSDTIERQPEALYRVAAEADLQYKNGESTIQGVSSQNSWHRMGSPLETVKHYPHVEPGPRSLDLSKDVTKTEEKKRTKREAESVIQKISRKRTKKQNDLENEVDFEDSISDNPEQGFLNDFSTSTETTRTTSFPEVTTYTMMGTSTTLKSTEDNIKSTTEDKKDVNGSEVSESTESYETEEDTNNPGTSTVSFMDVLKRLAQFKLRLGLNFLRSTTDLFSRYLDDIQRRVDESFVNTTTVHYNKRKNPWSRIFFSRLNNEAKLRKKRSVLDDTDFFNAMLTKEEKLSERFSKSTKKDLSPSIKIFHQKKIIPKKYKAKNTN